MDHHFPWAMVLSVVTITSFFLISLNFCEGLFVVFSRLLKLSNDVVLFILWLDLGERSLEVNLGHGSMISIIKAFMISCKLKLLFFSILFDRHGTKAEEAYSWKIRYQNNFFGNFSSGFGSASFYRPRLDWVFDQIGQKYAKLGHLN